MRAEILSTGEEVLNGAIVDSNSAYISQKLDEMGLRVARHSTVGDDITELVTVIREIGGRADVAIVTGGLGPTTDDLSADAAAEAVGVPLVMDPVALDHIASFFQQRGREMNPANKKQAYFPAGADRLDNPVGTAPGFAVTIGKCRFYFLPGVPFEMVRMLADLVLPKIKERLGNIGAGNVTRMLLTFGLPESTVSHRLTGFDSLFPRVQLGFQVKYPGIFVKLYRRGEHEAACRADIETAQSWVCGKLERHVVSTEGESMEEVVGRLLSQQQATLSVAESCTGGLISHWLTNVPGSSDYFLFSGVTYANAAKESILGVSPDTLKTNGAVHEQTVSEMAEGVRRITGATYGLATSGIAGPGGGTPDKPAGTVCIGLSAPDGTHAYRFHFSYGGRRLMNKQMFAMKALDLLRRKLIGDPS
ncbi:MAG: CinA family nicotinamide mononucleotide deamidase-related protein [Desulfobacterales bacterium]|jgi:nicotinamide-nucleotide amidase|nr:CinA family nicotinamide mononucleotide deamidase-related protein [Desulfobacterales bacterium]